MTTPQLFEAILFALLGLCIIVTAVVLEWRARPKYGALAEAKRVNDALRTALRDREEMLADAVAEAEGLAAAMAKAEANLTRLRQPNLN